MRLERTFDAALVQAILSKPGVKERIWEGDSNPAVPMHESIYYLIATDELYGDGAVEDVTLGVVGFIPVNNVAWNPHIAMHPECRGRGTEVMRAAIGWMFENTECLKVIAHPPAYHKAMIRVFEKCGLELEGCSPKSFRWNGILHARLLMGIDKEKHLCGLG